MDSPRLKFNNKEFGLRALSNNLFELKSEDVFIKYLDTDFVPTKENYLYKEKLVSKIEPESYRKIESFCFVTTENIKQEAALLLKSLRKFHKQPIYIICDEESKRYLSVLSLLDDKTFCKIEAKNSDLNNLDKKYFNGHKCIANEVHNAPAIFKKMDVMDYALQHHDNTFFLDSDIIVLDSLQEYFQAKVVLSPHYYPRMSIMKGFECGFYNAGYVFCASKGFPNLWRHLYLNDSTFFEQEGMNRISNYIKIQTFGKEHNVGFWREEVVPQKVKSFHFHTTDGVDKNRNKELKQLNKNITNIGLEYIKNNDSELYKFYLNLKYPKKVAFVHYGKAAGVYVNKYIKQTCLESYTKYFSHHANLNPFEIEKRDWSSDELNKIAIEAEDYSFITNHHINWNFDNIQQFKNNNWFTFMFIRNPEEILCSLFNWSKEKKFSLRGDKGNPNSLQEMFELAMKDKHFSRLWILPDYIDELDHVAEFSDKNFNYFLTLHFGEKHIPLQRENTSNNKGFKYYKENNFIEEETLNKFFNHPEYLKYKKYLD